MNVRKAFKTLKDCLTLAPILTLLEGSDRFMIYYNTSHVDLDYALMQHGKVIPNASRQLKVDEQNYPTYDLKLEAIVFVLKI